MPHPTLWQPHRRDFLRASSAALFGLLAGCNSARVTPQLRSPLRFGLLTDMHYADAPTTGTATRYYRESLVKTREAVTLLSAQNPEFLACLGDMKDMNAREPDTKTLSYLTAIEAEIRRFHGPTYHVLGNHDMDNLSKSQVLANITNTAINPNRSYYAVTKGRGGGGIRFITLDACCLKNGSDYDHGNFDWKETYIPDPQLAFLKAELQASSLPVILFVHQRLDGTADECIRNSAEVRPLLEASGKVLAAFHGHDHKGGHSLINGIHYYTLIAIVEGSGEASNSYALAEVLPNLTIQITGFRRAVTMSLPPKPASTPA